MRPIQNDCVRNRVRGRNIMSVIAVAVVLDGIKLAAAAEKISAAQQAEKVRESAIRSRMTEERLQATEKTLARDSQIQTLIGHQMAVEASSGFELSSQSFKAITMDDFNKFAQNRSNDALELDIKENQLQADMEQTKIKTRAQIFGTVLSTAASMLPSNGLFTNIANSAKGQAAKLSTGIDQDEFSDATDNALEKRQSGEGLFDNTDI